MGRMIHFIPESPEAAQEMSSAEALGPYAEAVARLAAFAVAPGHTVESLMSALRLRIDPAFLPRPLCMVEALPRNDIGKLPRESLARIVAGP